MGHSWNGIELSAAILADLMARIVMADVTRASLQIGGGFVSPMLLGGVLPFSTCDGMS